ncbi:uncharacterized protein METZ01_LOCUS178138 [marine metagenome]|jgi:hypothetical protein|uniref:Uncharacterized protein n=1 Tax=marine metagenome TaxID=408172 RepID=A0A382CHG8_9ZZZZ
MSLNSSSPLGWPVVIQNVTIQEFTLDGVKNLSQYPSFLFMYILTTILFLTMIIFFSILSYTICMKIRNKSKNVLLEDIYLQNDIRRL